MHSRIAKILVLGALMLALPMIAAAQTSRVEGMAIQGDYIKDYTGIFTYTSGVSSVGNLVYGELGVSTGGTPDDRAVGAVMGDWFEGRMGAWAIHMRQTTPQLGQGDAQSQPAPGDIGFDPNSHTSESFDIMWGRKFGTMALGLRLNRSYGEVELSDATGPITDLKMDWVQVIGAGADPNLSRNVMGLAAGAGFELNPSMNLEANIAWQSRTFSADSAGITTDEDDASTTYQIAARLFWQTQPNVMVVPVVKFYSYDLSTSNYGTGTAENTLKGWQVGAAGNWTIGSNDLFVLGLTFAQNKIEQEEAALGVDTPLGFLSTADGTITETFMPQLFAALETHVNSWLTVRFGANKGAWHKVELEDNASTANLKLSDSPFSMSLGAGVKVGSLQFDAIVNDVFPHNGFNFISGNVTSPIFPKVTATYAF